MFPDSFHAIASLPQHAFKKPLSYGTAGFRTRHNFLDSAMFRVGVVAALRARASARVVGVMITASHNPEEDNGAKIVDFTGGMLAESWEAVAEAAVNAKSVDELQDVVRKNLPSDAAASGVVVVGRDTRASSERLAKLVARGIFAAGCLAEDYGVMSTPVIHHVVRCANGFGLGVSLASKSGYFEQMISAYKELVGERRRKIAVDCAGGVGALMMSEISCLDVEILNNPGRAKLNHKCGAEHVQKTRTAPELAEISDHNLRPKVVASLDGDADRLVYSMHAPDGTWKLLDGDKIAALFGLFIKKQLSELACGEDISVFDFVNVQTAYANGAARNFFESLQIPVKLAKTGVKFVEAVAHEHQIGMYFEANGHGTVVFSEKLNELWGVFKDSPARRRIAAFARLINQAVGDAISDLLAVEAVLEVLDMSYEAWSELYEDLPSRQGKVAVSDRTVVKCSADETRVLHPAVLQGKIDSLVSKFAAGRAFVRPSGTEDAVRIYAEASTQAQANELAYLVASATVQTLGGDQPVLKEVFGL